MSSHGTPPPSAPGRRRHRRPRWCRPAPPAEPPAGPAPAPPAASRLPLPASAMAPLPAPGRSVVQAGVSAPHDDDAAPGRCASATRLFDFEQVDDEDKGRSRRDIASPSGLESPRRWGDQLAAAAHSHIFQPFFPPPDQFVTAKREAEWLASIPRRIELLAGFVVNLDVVKDEFVPRMSFRTPPPL